MKSLSDLQICKLIFVLAMMITFVSSSPNKERLKLENSEDDCSKESCQELRERVESLEKAVRTIVAALTSNDDTNVPSKSFENHQDIAMHINKSSEKALMANLNEGNKIGSPQYDLILRSTRENLSDLRAKFETQEIEITTLKAEGQMQSKRLLQAQHEINMMKATLARSPDSRKPLVIEAIETISKPHQVGANISQEKIETVDGVRRRSKRIAVKLIRNRDDDSSGSDFIDLHPSSSDNCGQSLALDKKVTGGDDARLGDWPWMASLLMKHEGDDTSSCGGVLISDLHVLTAAHCFDDMGLSGGNNVENRVMVTLGLHKKSSPHPHTLKFGEAAPLIVVLHEGYDPVTLVNDVAIIVLDRKVQFNQYIQPICLPLLLGSPLSFENKIARIAGWGRTTTEKPHRFPDVIQDAAVPVVQLDYCKKAFAGLGQFRVTDMHICAGKNGTNTCRGDSGGPLMYKIGNRWTTIGIVSWGTRSCDGQKPGVFGGVHFYMDWVKQKLQFREYDSISTVIASAWNRILNMEQQLASRKKQDRPVVWLFTYNYHKKLSDDDLPMKMKEYFDGLIGSKEHGAFDKETGTFTVKTPGVYQFHTEWDFALQTGFVNLVVNGRETYLEDQVLELENGDEVSFILGICRNLYDTLGKNCNSASIQLSAFLLSS